MKHFIALLLIILSSNSKLYSNKNIIFQSYYGSNNSIILEVLTKSYDGYCYLSVDDIESVSYFDRELFINSSMKLIDYDTFYRLSLVRLYLRLNASLVNQTINVRIAYKSSWNGDFDQDDEFKYEIGNFTFYTILNEGYNRIEQSHPAVYALGLLFYIVIFVLLILFRNKQPLASRGVVPFVSCIVHLLILASNPIKFLSLDQLRVNSICLIAILMAFPLIVTIIQLSVLHYLRFIILINLNKRKENLIGSDRMLILMKRLSKWYFTLAIITILFIIFQIIFDFSIALGICSNNINYIYNTLIILTALSMIPIAIYDIVINFDKIRKCQVYQFWKEDVFYIRFEIFFLGFIVCFTYFVVLNIVSRFSGFVAVEKGLVYAIFNSILYFLIFFFQALFSLSITIFNTIYYKFFKRPTDNELIEIVSNLESRNLLYAFAKNEYSIENLLCYEDIQRYKANPSTKLASNIFNLYLCESNSELEVNVQSSIVKDLKVIFDKGEFPNDLFDKIEQTLLTNLSDTFSRFIFTSDYINMMKSKELVSSSVK